MIEMRRNLGVNIFSENSEAYNTWNQVSVRGRDDYRATYTFNERTYDVLDVKEHYESFNSLVRLRNLALAILVTILSVGFAVCHPVVQQWFTGRQVVVILKVRSNLPPDFQPYGGEQPQVFDGEKGALIADLRAGRLDRDQDYVGCRGRLEPFRGDRDVALAAVSQDGLFLQFFDDAIKDDRDIAMAAVGQKGLALLFTSQRFKNDREVVLTAVQQDGNALVYVGEDPLLGASFKDDEEVVLAAVNQNGNARQHANIPLRDQENVKQAARDQLRPARIADIRFYSPETPSNPSIGIFQLEDGLFNDDEEMLFEIVQRWPLALERAGLSCRNNKRIALAAVERNGLALQYVSDGLKNDQEVVFAAVRSEGYALQYAHADLKRNERIVLAAVRCNGAALEHADADLKRNEPIVLAAVQQNGLVALYYADLKGNETIVRAAIRQNFLALQFADAHLKENEEIVLEAVRQDRNGTAFRFAGPGLRGSKELVLRIIAEGKGAILEHVSPELQRDKEVVLAAVKKDPRALQHAAREFWYDKDVLLAAFCSCSGYDQGRFNDTYIRNNQIQVDPGASMTFASLEEFKNYFISTGEILPDPSLGNGRYVLASREF